MYKYKVLNERGIFEEYSGLFYELKQAEKWYEKHGKWLENKFNHKLYLFKSNERVSDRLQSF